MPPPRLVSSTHLPPRADYATDIALRDLDCMMRMGMPSQHGEDWLLWPTLANMHNGKQPHARRFVELGAYTGKEYSNTYVLEKCFNWTGVLIEANPKNFAALQSAGRQGSQLVHSGICDGDGSTGSTIAMTVDGLAVAGQIGAMSQGYLNNQRAGDNISDVVHVPCRSLQSILRAGKPTPNTNHKARFALLSLDVEGAEDLVIRTIDPALFSMIVVEMDGYDRAKDLRVHQAITAAGLRQATRLLIARSHVYVRPSVVEKRWTAHSSVWRGNCGATEFSSDETCNSGVTKGAWRMGPGSPLGIVDTPSCISHCKRACGSRCRFVSVSAVFHDCSWYSSCDAWGEHLNKAHEMPLASHFSVRVSRVATSKGVSEPSPE